MNSRNLKKIGAYKKYIWIISLVSFMGLWQIITMIFSIPTYLLPSPFKVFLTLATDIQVILDHFVVTLEETVAGLGLAIAVGIFIAVLMNTFQITGELIYPYLVLSQAIPLIAVAPLVLIWFGLGIFAKVLIVAFVCFFPISVNTYEGFQAINEEMLDFMDTLNASKWQRYRHLDIPASLPGIFAGIKIAATYSVLGAVIGEWLGGIKGIGIYMTRALNSFRTDRLFGAIMIVMVTSFLIFKLVDWLGNKITPWTKEEV